MTKFEAMFHIPLIRNEIEDWEEKKEKLLKLANSSKFSMDSDESVLSNIFEKEDSINQIQEILGEDINQCEMLLREGCELKISNAWFEKSRKGKSNHIYNQGNLGYSGICYIQFDEKEHTSLYFVAPYNDIKNGETIRYHPYVREGTILIFPSFLHHFIIPNESNKDIIWVAFNFSNKWISEGSRPIPSRSTKRRVPQRLRWAGGYPNILMDLENTQNQTMDSENNET